MTSENTIRKQIQITKQHKIIAAIHLFFKHEDFIGSKIREDGNQKNTILSAMNYYLEQENWVFRTKARENTILFFKQLEVVLNNTDAAAEQKIEQLVLKYIQLLFDKPDFAAYLITNLRYSSNQTDLDLQKHLEVLNALFVRKSEGLNNFNSISVIINLIGMILLPLAITGCQENNEDSLLKGFENIIERRKKLLPLWIRSVRE